MKHTDSDDAKDTPSCSAREVEVGVKGSFRGIVLAA